VGAWRNDAQDYIGMWRPGSAARGVELPFRAHQILMDPLRQNSVIAIARRPGEFLARVDLDAMRVTRLKLIDAQFVTNGHAVFLAESDTLLVTENDAMTGDGWLGIYDTESLENRGRYPTFGIGPHALLREPNGSLLIANGGVLTMAQTGRTRLNAHSIDASLVRLEFSGRRLGQWRLANPHLSIRHLARASDGTVGVALQNESPEPDEHAPVFAWFDSQAFHLSANPQMDLGGYGGDVACIESSGEVLFAVGCTRADCVALWDAAGTFRGAYPLRNACALTADGASLVAISERGEVGVLDTSNRDWNVFNGAPAWDNHALVWTASQS
jgi:hypothetical protein